VYEDPSGRVYFPADPSGRARGPTVCVVGGVNADPSGRAGGPTMCGLEVLTRILRGGRNPSDVRQLGG
jgi:hypothetical protein